MFLTGQREVEQLCTRLRKHYATAARKKQQAAAAAAAAGAGGLRGAARLAAGQQGGEDGEGAQQQEPEGEEEEQEEEEVEQYGGGGDRAEVEGEGGGRFRRGEEEGPVDDYGVSGRGKEGKGGLGMGCTVTHVAKASGHVAGGCRGPRLDCGPAG